ncbi:MAG: hypothetical protein MK171_06720 [Pirellulales bacterium]|nr:hypothetical protein [Pirellulales bacterium]
MAYDDEDDLFGEEFDFVDDDEGDIQADTREDESGRQEAATDESSGKKEKPKRRTTRGGNKRRTKSDSDGDDSETVDTEAAKKPEEDPGPPPPPTDHVVHIYEFGNFVRTIQREFTSEDAEAFATEFNRTSKSYSRAAVPAGKDEEAALSI